MSREGPGAEVGLVGWGSPMGRVLWAAGMELEAKVFLPTTVGDSEVIDIHSPTVPLFLIPNAKGG